MERGGTRLCARGAVLLPPHRHCAQALQEAQVPRAPQGSSHGRGSRQPGMQGGRKIYFQFSRLIF